MKEALKLALEEMKIANYNSAAERLEAALAQPAQEPWCMGMNGCKTKCADCPDEPAQEPVAKVVLTKTLRLPCLQWLDLSRQFDIEDGQLLYTHPPTAPAQPLSLEDSLSVANPCCGKYANCSRPCTPRGRWEAQQAQQLLTDDEIIKLADYHTTYQIESPSTSGMLDFARAIEAKLKEKNT
jgi:hypothetical protein